MRGWRSEALQNIGKNKPAAARLPASEAKALFEKPKRSGKPVKWQSEGVRIDIKPASVNDIFKGRRFRNAYYNTYEKTLLFLLPKLSLPEPPYKLNIVFGFSNAASDIDNPCKPFLDILQKKYGFNDKHIIELNIRKEIVKKGSEFIVFDIQKAATEGNTAMQVWLGKQRLGQKDKQELDMTTNGKDMPAQIVQIYLPSNGRENPEPK